MDLVAFQALICQTDIRYLWPTEVGTLLVDPTKSTEKLACVPATMRKSMDVSLV